MKKRLLGLFLAACMVLTLLPISGRAAAAAGGETVGLTPLFTNGTTRVDYDATDGGGNTTAYGFIAGQAYTLTLNMTAASLATPELAITIPANYALDFYTPANNATIAPYLVAANPISQTTDTEGRLILTYRFRDNTTAVGFTVTVRPKLKLKDGEICTVLAELRGNGDVTTLASASTSVRIYNPSVHLDAFRAGSGYSQITYTLNDPVTPVALGGSITDNYSGRYAYDTMQIILPLPADASPGYYDGGTFAPIVAGKSRDIIANAVTVGTVTYCEGFASTDASGKSITIPRALAYELNSAHPLCQGLTSNASFSTLGGIYLQFPATTTTTGGTKYYISPYTAQVSAKIDGSGTLTVLLNHTTSYSLYYTFQEYNLSNYFYQRVYSSYDQFDCGSYLLPVEDNQYFYSYFYNNTGSTIESIVTDYSFDQLLYVNRLVFSLSSAAGSQSPGAAMVTYKTKSGGDTEFTASLSPTNSTLSLTDPADMFTSMRVTFDRLGSSASAILLKAYVVNRDNLASGIGYVRSQILSATCPTALTPSGTIGAQGTTVSNLQPRRYFDSVYPQIGLSQTTLNKGDSFAVRVYPTYSFPQQLTDLNIYILMPSEYVYSSFTPAAGYAGAAPTHTTRAVVVAPETATAQVPAGAYALHTFAFPGTFKSNAYAYHSFYFEVGPLVDTATARTNVYLPAAVAMTQSNPTYRYSPSAAYQMTDVWDFDGDGDVTEKLTVSNQSPTVTINAASALSAKSYLTTSYAPGTEAAAQSYQYNSTGLYRFYLYNGLASGNNASDIAIDISLPRDGTTTSYQGSTYTSSWNALLTGAPAFTDSSGFLAGATVSYSTDSGLTYRSELPADWSAVTNVRISSAPGQSLVDGKSVVVDLPIRARFGDGITAGARAYFGNAMQYKLTSSGELLNAITVAPVTMQPAAVTISGTVYQDLNGNLMQDGSENGHGTSYPVRLYAIAAGGSETLRASTTTNASTGAYSFDVLQPGDYRLAVIKSSASQYFPLGTDDRFADDGTCSFSISGGVTSLSHLDLGILVPRTVTVNPSSVRVVDGHPQQIVPIVSSALTGSDAVTYTSSDESVVTVSSDGLITYVGDGNAIITLSVPQLSAVIAAQGAGASGSATANVAVVSQDDTCNISADPYIGSAPTAARAQAIATATGGAPYARTFYYFFNRSGYCNDPSHTYSEGLVWATDAGRTTASGAGILQSGSSVTVSATGLGTIALTATETDEHACATPLTLTVTISKPEIIGVSFSGLTVTYDGAPHAITISGALPAGASVTYSGNSGSNAGVYNATATISGGADYSDLTLHATLTINKAELTATVGDYQKTYGDPNPAFTVDVSGFVNSDTAATAAGYTAPTASTTATGAGVAIITINGGAATNYTFDTSDTGTLTINRKTLTATGITAADKPFDGTDQATLRTAGAALSGVLPGDDVTLNTSHAVGTFADAQLGRAKTVTVTGLALAGPDIGNYVLAGYTTTASIDAADEAQRERPTQGGVAILVNGETQNDSATAVTTNRGDQTVTTVVVDPAKLSARLEAEGEHATVTIPVRTGADQVVGVLTGEMVKEMEARVATVQVVTDRASYTLPAEQINIARVAEQLGQSVSLQDVLVHVQIAELSAEAARVVASELARGNYQLVVPPVDFSISCTYGDETVEVSHFNAYVERQIAIPEGVDPAKITTAVVVEPDGTLRHVPTRVTIVGGKYYAQINSLTNSTYTLIWSPVTYDDMAAHWAKDAVEDMGSRLVMTGDGRNVFGDRAITRGEFVITLIKALGLQPQTGVSLFSDVATGSDLSGYLRTAVQYDLVHGFPGGVFAPDQPITREQAMMIMVVAAKVVDLKDTVQPEQIDTLLAPYTDVAGVSTWAKNAVAGCLHSGLIIGRPGRIIAPRDSITRGETATIMQRLLSLANLI